MSQSEVEAKFPLVFRQGRATLQNVLDLCSAIAMSPCSEPLTPLGPPELDLWITALNSSSNTRYLVFKKGPEGYRYLDDLQSAGIRTLYFAGSGSLYLMGSDHLSAFDLTYFFQKLSGDRFVPVRSPLVCQTDKAGDLQGVCEHLRKIVDQSNDGVAVVSEAAFKRMLRIR